MVISRSYVTVYQRVAALALPISPAESVPFQRVTTPAGLQALEFFQACQDFRYLKEEPYP